jgi:threonine/homoserine/homoserine lactone efflux protein
MSDLLVSLITFAAIATASPGGATTLATASGAQFGLARSVPLILGIAFGLALLVGAVGGGLGVAVQTFPQMQLALRLAGSIYLLWLAWTIANLGAPTSRSDAATSPLSFLKGLLLLLLNPQAWRMAVASASVYAGLADAPTSLALILGTVFGVSATVSLSSWCLGGQWLARQLKTERQWRIVNVSLAVLLVLSIVPMWR